MEITMARGDLEVRTFQVLSENEDNLEPCDEVFDEIYMTVKKNRNDHVCRFQKRMSDGGIISLGEGKYEFTIHPEDTNRMAFGEYIFDIELVKNGSIKKTFCGELILTDEVTHASNEVVRT